MSTQVTEAPDRQRFEAHVDGRLAGRVEYRLDGDTVHLVHTEVEDGFEGQGIGSSLARGTLDALRDAGRPVVNECPFLQRWIEKHPDYQDVLV
jgi:predicted GNAT family acetyltransferase